MSSPVQREHLGASEAPLNEADRATAMIDTKDKDGDVPYPWHRTYLGCIKATGKQSGEFRNSNILHCPADFDLLSSMCWPPTRAGENASHPCTPDGFLNPYEKAHRFCLSNGTWFVNASHGPGAYTDWKDCLKPWVISNEEKLRKLAGDKIVRMLNAIDEHRRLYVSLFIFAIFLLALSIVVCGVVLVHLKYKIYRVRSVRRQRRRSSVSVEGGGLFALPLPRVPRPHTPHALLVVAAAVLFVDNVVTVILSRSGWPDYLTNCRAYKSVDVLSMLIFYQCMLGYVVMGVARILRRRMKPTCVRIIVILSVTFTTIIVVLELVAEVVIFPTHYCGFGNMQGSFHWIFTAPKYLTIMCTICLAICIAYGVFFLPRKQERARRKFIQTNLDNNDECFGQVEECGESNLLVAEVVNGDEERRETEGEETLSPDRAFHYRTYEIRGVANNRRTRGRGVDRTPSSSSSRKEREEEDVMTLRHLKQGSISVLITIAFSLMREALVVLLHTITAKNSIVANSVAGYVAPHELISHYGRMYALTTSLHGTVFAIAMCLCDVRVVALLTSCCKSCTPKCCKTSPSKKRTSFPLPASSSSSSSSSPTQPRKNSLTYDQEAVPIKKKRFSFDATFSEMDTEEGLQTRHKRRSSMREERVYKNVGDAFQPFRRATLSHRPLQRSTRGSSTRRQANGNSRMRSSGQPGVEATYRFSKKHLPPLEESV